jgi:hypothetical protein
MSFEPRDYLRHILVETDYLVAQAAGLTREQFLSNETLRRAFVRSFEMPLHLTAPGPARACPSRSVLSLTSRVPQVSGRR